MNNFCKHCGSKIAMEINYEFGTETLASALGKLQGRSFIDPETKKGILFTGDGNIEITKDGRVSDVIDGGMVEDLTEY